MTKDIATLSVGLSSGLLTEKMIKDELGEGILSEVIAFSGATYAGTIASDTFSKLSTDVGLDDIFSSVDDIFNDIF